ncbi:unnamed protein product [Durusdinium trenchii]|uniref:Uncharacterized protein n=2 Tax=Durusdinium trenchii TaxID=1381693 RepID=A0ABP0LSN0_9DINO
MSSARLLCFTTRKTIACSHSLSTHSTASRLHGSTCPVRGSRTSRLEALEWDALEWNGTTEPSMRPKCQCALYDIFRFNRRWQLDGLVSDCRKRAGMERVESVDFTQPLRDGQPVDKTESKKESICSKPTAKWLSHPLTPSELTGEEVDDRIS